MRIRKTIAVTILLALFVAGGVWLRVGSGSDDALTPVPSDPAKIVRLIDLADFPVGKDGYQFGGPSEIMRFADIAKHIPEKGWAEKIGNQVDFRTERLLFFRWRSYEGDKLHYRVTNHSVSKKPIIAFWRIPGKASDEPGYFYHAFAVSKAADWQLIDEPKDDVRSTVRDLDLMEIFHGMGGPDLIDLDVGGVEKPIVIRSANDLAKLGSSNGHFQIMVQQQVDFARDHILFFTWSGSGQDRLWFELPKANDVRVRYSAGKTKNDQQHYRMLVIANEAAWKLEPAAGNEHPPVRETHSYGGIIFHEDNEPLVIDSLEVASKAFPNPMWRKNLAAEVDFAKQRLLYFYWEGSGQDDMSTVVAMGPNRKSVRFNYHTGSILNLATHYHLYVVDRDVEYAGTTLWAGGRSSFTGVAELPIDASKCTTPAGDYAKPIVITSKADLLQKLGSKEVVAKINRPVAIDFNWQQLLLFCWDGKVGTELAYTVHGWEPKSKTIFYQPRVGKAALAKRYLHLYTMPKGMQWQVLSPGERPFGAKGIDAPPAK